MAGLIALGVALWLLLGQGKPAGAVDIAIRNLPSAVAQGADLAFTVDITIPAGELIPIQRIEVDIKGPTPIRVLFNPSGLIVTGDPRVRSVRLISSPNVAYGYRYGYDPYAYGYGYGYRPGYGYGYQPGYGYGYGYAQPRGQGYFFGYGYGYGYGGYGYKSYRYVYDYGAYKKAPITKLTYVIQLDTRAMQTGRYTAQVHLHTGSYVKPTFSSRPVEFVVAPAGAFIQPSPGPTITPSPTPDILSEIVSAVMIEADTMLQTPDGKVQVDIPAWSLPLSLANRQVQVAVKHLNPARLSPPPQGVTVVRGIELQTLLDGQVNPVTYTQPVVVTLPMEAAELQQVGDISMIRAFRFNNRTNLWEVLPTSFVPQGAVGAVVTRTDRFSFIAVGTVPAGTAR